MDVFRMTLRCCILIICKAYVSIHLGIDLGLHFRQ